MADQWKSIRLYEHPAKHQAGTYGNVVLSTAGIYALRVGSSTMSCPQDWATKIHNKENLETTQYILRDIPDVLWQQAKHRAIDEKISLKELLLRALQKYLQK